MRSQTHRPMPWHPPAASKEFAALLVEQAAAVARLIWQFRTSAAAWRLTGRYQVVLSQSLTAWQSDFSVAGRRVVSRRC